MLTNYCRICLTSIGVVHQLDEVVHKSLTLYAMLCKLYPEAFTDHRDQHWPSKVCGNCKHGILEAYRLYAVCMTSLGLLKKQLQNSSIQPNHSTGDIDPAVDNNSLSGNDGIDFKKAVIIIDDEEGNVHCLTSDHEDEFDSETEETNSKEHDSCETFSLNKQDATAHESTQNTSPLQPQNPVSVAKECGARTWKTVDSVERWIKMAASIEQEHAEDSEESMEYLDDGEDSFHATENDDDPAENEMVETAVAEQTVSNTIMKSRCLKDDSDESEDEDIFAKVFSSEIFSCKSCRDVFLDKESHVKHMRDHSKGYKKFCKICKEGFKTETALCAHDCYSNYSTLCWICGKITNAWSKTHVLPMSHRPSKRPEKVWSCQLCPLQFDCEHVLKPHLLTHSDQNLYCCDVCGMKLTSKRNLQQHQWTRHTATKEQLYIFSCEICNQRFTNSYVLKKHMNTHTGPGPYSCVYCNRVYDSGDDLVEHVAKHHVGNDNIYQCHLCDADFPKIRALKCHYEVHFIKGGKFYNEILTDFGKFRFTTMDLLKMRRRKQMAVLSSDNANNKFPSRSKRIRFQAVQKKLLNSTTSVLKSTDRK